MIPNSSSVPQALYAERIRIRGTVQGVGFRPMVWTVAKRLNLAGHVQNDGHGVQVQLYGPESTIDKFVSSIYDHCPCLATIESLERHPLDLHKAPPDRPNDFTISASKASKAKTHIPPDSATCEQCIEDIKTSDIRRFKYPFTNCTHCGPRLSIITGIPYDRAQTSMSSFTMCKECLEEYNDPANRRFHAQPNACQKCGPQLWLEDSSGTKLFSSNDALIQTAKLIKQGKIAAIKGIGGFHLAVDAYNTKAIKKLRNRKHRADKPFALMAKDIDQIKRYCHVSEAESKSLLSSASPIVLLKRNAVSPEGDCLLAPRQQQLGFMLPYSPLHHLLLQQLEHPIVLTSGNLSSEPQCITNEDARERLCSDKQQLADFLLLHDRNIENRIDDSVVHHMAGELRVLRRARGYAPAPVQLHTDFNSSPEILAMGGELKNTFCLLQNQQAVLSQHIGDLESYTTYEDYQRNLALYKDIYQHNARIIVVDKHPEYLSTKLGINLGQTLNIPVLEVQHHHAHIAACLAENKQALTSKPVLGIALDGLGFGDDGTLWGGEFLLADYLSSTRLASFTPVPLIGGIKAIQEPWRNSYAHFQAAQDSGSCLWDVFQQFTNVEIVDYLSSKPLQTFNQMIEQEINSPLTSSCGRLFDAVAATIGICAEKISYEGQAAIELESVIKHEDLTNLTPYRFSILEQNTISQIDATPMWRMLLTDLATGKSQSHMSARFHLGLANSVVNMSKRLINNHGITQAVLTGGVFQNSALLEHVAVGLQDSVEVLTHRLSPTNDGGLALGQATIAAAHQIVESNRS